MLDNGIMNDNLSYLDQLLNGPELLSSSFSSRNVHEMQIANLQLLLSGHTMRLGS